LNVNVAVAVHVGQTTAGPWRFGSVTIDKFGTLIHSPSRQNFIQHLIAGRNRCLMTPVVAEPYEWQAHSDYRSDDIEDVSQKPRWACWARRPHASTHEQTTCVGRSFDSGPHLSDIKSIRRYNQRNRHPTPRLPSLKPRSPLAGAFHLPACRVASGRPGERQVRTGIHQSKPSPA
jgi:hypothetical protein